MNVDPGAEPIEDDEILYRRIPVSMDWYGQAGLSPEAYAPRRHDATGISLYRKKYKTIEDAAKGPSKQGYYIALLHAGELKQNGIRVEPRPLPDDPGHAELPDLTYQNRKTPETRDRKDILQVLTLEVKGPFPPAETT